MTGKLIKMIPLAPPHRSFIPREQWATSSKEWGLGTQTTIYWGQVALDDDNDDDNSNNPYHFQYCYHYHHCHCHCRWHCHYCQYHYVYCYYWSHDYPIRVVAIIITTWLHVLISTHTILTNQMTRNQVKNHAGYNWTYRVDSCEFTCFIARPSPPKLGTRAFIIDTDLQ